MPTIDFHNHFYPPEYIKAIEQGPSAVRITHDSAGNPCLHYPGDYNVAVPGHRDIEYREQVLKESGVDTQVITLTTPGTHIEGAAAAVRLARLVNDAFARIENSEAFVYNADIQPYEKASHDIPVPKRVRKLLLHRQEIDKLYGESQVKGRALVVLKLYWKNGKLKAEIGVGQGKVARDKRADLKKRTVERETAREVARFNRKHR